MIVYYALKIREKLLTILTGLQLELENYCLSLKKAQRLLASTEWKNFLVKK
jgi:hypothetical protein